MRQPILAVHEGGKPDMAERMREARRENELRERLKDLGLTEDEIDKWLDDDRNERRRAA